MLALEAKDWVMVGATIAGPVLAVQAQKWVERAREATNRRALVFTTLMATRQSRISMEHVRALNSIDLAFYGHRVLGVTVRRRVHQAVLDAWHDYYEHLCVPDERRPKNDAELRDWTGRGDELFTNLLERLATATNFKFDRKQLKAGSYSPEAHGAVELEQQAVRRLALDVMSGQKALPMEVKAWPVDAAAVEQQRNTQAELVQRHTELVQNQREMMGDFKQILERLTDRAVSPHTRAAAPAEPRTAEPAREMIDGPRSAFWPKRALARPHGRMVAQLNGCNWPNPEARSWSTVALWHRPPNFRCRPEADRRSHDISTAATKAIAAVR